MCVIWEKKFNSETFLDKYTSFNTKSKTTWRISVNYRKYRRAIEKRKHLMNTLVSWPWNAQMPLLTARVPIWTWMGACACVFTCFPSLLSCLWSSCTSWRTHARRPQARAATHLCARSGERCKVFQVFASFLIRVFRVSGEKDATTELFWTCRIKKKENESKIFKFRKTTGLCFLSLAPASSLSSSSFSSASVAL